MSRRSAVLALVVALGFGARIAYLWHTTSQPRYEWHDPDHYKLKGRALARGGWHWTFDAVRHSSYDHRFYVLPPGYPVFLSLFAMFPGYPFSAQVGQVFMSTATIVLLFFIGRRIHSDRAGLIAAAIYAAWLPNVIAVWSTMQESIYVPIVCAAFVLLLRAVDRKRHPWDYVAAGAVFGVATLTRSMPIYVMPFLAALMFWQERRQSWRNIAALGAGFLALTLPYSVALSLHLERPTFVENHGSIYLIERYGGLEGDDPASLTETASILVGAFADAPAETMRHWWATMRSVFHVNGGRLLQIYLGSATRARALLAKLAAHLFADLSFVLSLLLAPVGVALCRRRDLAGYLVVWIVINLALTVLSGFGGSRLRAPFEPHLITLAAVVLAGGYRAIAAGLVALATATSVLLGALVVPQVPASLSARADYGVHWPLKAPPKRSAMEGSAGFNVLAVDDVVRFQVRSRNEAGDTDVAVRIGGEDAERIRISDREHRFELPWPSGTLAHVELDAVDAKTGQPVRLYVIVPSSR